MFKSIKEQGGLEVFLPEQGINYKYFCEIDDSGIDNTAMYKVLKKHYPLLEANTKTRLSVWKVRNWRKVRKAES